MTSEPATDRRQERADALLNGLQREADGRLTVFLGAAAGVGKTYTMLTRARELEKRGVDVVVGVVETHGRSETQALLDGLEQLPRRRIAYRGTMLEELDLDALLARRPRVALVDELAHRNVPGSRHEHRWQGVQELLDAGIDVYTTINIQHLESLNDVVHRITGVRVRETVPDVVFDRLRDIVLVDLPPRDLIERLQQGKVYVPEQAARALQAFFSPSNLAALRELAMQTAADRVDSDLREAQLARGLPGVPLRRRVLVAIDGRGQSEYLVRMARRLAERRDAPWTVLTVQRGVTVDAARQTELDRAFALARRLGADTEVLHGDSILDAILDHAARIGVNSIVLGRTRERPLARMFNRTLTQQLLHRGAHYELTIVSTPQARARARRSWRRDVGRGPSAKELAGAVLAAVAATAVAAIAEQGLGLTDLSAVFIVAVLVVATRTGMAAVALAAVLCFLSYNFFFIDPRLTLLIGAGQGVATVLLFLAAALVAGRLASRLRQQVLALRAANAHAIALQALGRDLAAAADLGQVIGAGERALRRATGAESVVLAGKAASEATLPADWAPKDRAAADWALRHRQPAGRHTDTLGNAAWWFLPLSADERTPGLVGLRPDPGTARPPPELLRLVEAMTTDIAQAVLRAEMAADLERARLAGETERLRSVLLSSVSHDLRSPLAAIIGAAGSLDAYGEAMDARDRHSLLETVRLEGERLDRYIQNLLDMTRLGHGGLTLERDWIGVDELIGSVTARLQRYHPGVRFDIRIAAGIAPVWVHPALIEQAVVNVIENAARFSPPGEAIALDARDVDGRLRLEVRDRGPGIPEDERERVFDPFFRLEHGDRRRQGTGLGLAIAQGMVAAHGGNVEALPGVDGHGTTIRITLPRVLPPDTSALSRE